MRVPSANKPRARLIQRNLSVKGLTLDRPVFLSSPSLQSLAVPDLSKGNSSTLQ